MSKRGESAATGPGIQGVGTRPEDGEEFHKGGKNDLSHGPLKKRHCTDILFCLLFIAHWVGVVVIASVAFKTGNPNRLVAGRDFEKYFCGYDDIHKDGAIAEGIESTRQDFQRLGFTIDLENLPADFPYTDQSKWAAELDYKKFRQYFKPVCLRHCPCFDDAFNESSLACPKGSQKTTTERAFFHGSVKLFAMPKSVCPYDPQHCLPLKSDPIPILDRYCLPKFTSQNVTVDKYIPSGLIDSWTSFIGDVRIVWPVLGMVALIAFFLGLIYLIFLRICAGFIVWFALVLTFIMFAVGGWACWDYKDEVEGDSSKQALHVLGIIVWSIGGLLVLVCICLCNQIRTGIAIVRTAAMFVSNVPTVLLLPLSAFMMTIALYTFWIVAALFIMSSVDEENVSTGKRFSWNKDTQRVFAYHCFSLLWNNAFIIGMNQMIIAGAVGAWYFTAPDANGNKRPGGAVRRSWKNALIYHMGSVAFGSLILAVVQFIKWTLRYLAYQANYAKANPSTACAKCSPCGIGAACSALGPANLVYSKILMCLGYLVACFERCIKFLNRNAYIQVALQGKNFCRSAWSAFCLILRNFFRISALAIVGRALRYLGIVCIVVTTGVSGFFIQHKWKGHLISSPIFPTLLYCTLGWVIGATMLDVLALAIDTTLHCFIADEEMSGKGLGGEFTPAPLRDRLSDPDAGCCSCCGGGKKASNKHSVGG